MMLSLIDGRRACFWFIRCLGLNEGGSCLLVRLKDGYLLGS